MSLVDIILKNIVTDFLTPEQLDQKNLHKCFTENFIRENLYELSRKGLVLKIKAKNSNNRFVFAYKISNKGLLFLNRQKQTIIIQEKKK